MNIAIKKLAKITNMYYCQVLMRALRDFNIPKIVTDDLPVFMGLIGDLFPALDVPRKRDPEFEKVIRVSIYAMTVKYS